MKKCFYPLVTIALVSGTCLFTGCEIFGPDTPPPKTPIDIALEDIDDMCEQGEKYKTHDKLPDKYVIPNASLATSQLLYLPVGGALTDLVKETVGNEYLRSYLLVQTNSTSFLKIWDGIRKEISNGWMDMKPAERTAFLANWEDMKKRLNDSTVSNPMTHEEFDAEVNRFDKKTEKAYYDLYGAESVLIANLDWNKQNDDGSVRGFLQDPEDIKEARVKMADQIKDIDSIPDELLKYEVINELVRVRRTQEACIFMSKNNDEKDFFLASLAEIGEDETYKNWLGLYEGNHKSSVYDAFNEQKRIAEEKISKERKDALENTLKEDAKVAAFTGYWISNIGKTIYPNVAELIPGEAGQIMSASSVVAVPTLGLATDSLEKEYEWLPESLVLNINDYPSLISLFGKNASTKDIMLKLSKTNFVESLLDKEKLALIENLVTKNYSDPFSLLDPDLLKGVDLGLTLVSTVKTDLSDKEYGMLPLHIIELVGNKTGLDFINALKGELAPYRYANDIAVKRIEYTAKALEWVSGNSLQDFFKTLSAE